MTLFIFAEIFPVCPKNFVFYSCIFFFKNMQKRLKSLTKCLCLLPGSAISINSFAWQVKDNRELQKMADEDQQERAHTVIDWNVLSRQDSMRRGAGADR